jgi:hypothetical protein
MTEQGKPVLKERGSFWVAIRTVAWSFLGVRRRSGFEDDLQRVSPFHVVLVGLAAALVFVVGLMALVNWVVKV